MTFTILKFYKTWKSFKMYHINFSVCFLIFEIKSYKSTSEFISSLVPNLDRTFLTLLLVLFCQNVSQSILVSFL